MQKVKFPTVEEMQECRNKILKRLDEKPMRMFKNAEIKEGYTDCIRILDERIENPHNAYFIPETDEEVELSNQIYRNQLKGIDKLKTIRGRSIAIMCIDYLNGRITQKTLCAIKIAKR